jgi:hypothetical protein
MAGAPKGNKNALKHGLYAKKALRGEVVDDPSTTALRASAQGDGARESLLRAIRYLEQVMDELHSRMRRAKGDEYTRLSNSLALAATALFNGHRTVAYLLGGLNPVEDAIKELKALDFAED